MSTETEDQLARLCERQRERMAHLEQQLIIAEFVVNAARVATCDSHSGQYCEDDSCANKVLVAPLATYDNYVSKLEAGEFVEME